MEHNTNSNLSNRNAAIILENCPISKHNSLIVNEKIFILGKCY